MGFFSSSFLSRRRFLYAASAAATVMATGVAVSTATSSASRVSQDADVRVVLGLDPNVRPFDMAKIPSRAEQVKRLKETPTFDVLVVGAGSFKSTNIWHLQLRALRTKCALSNHLFFLSLSLSSGCVGSGAALDATARGLKVALVEREDFASGTSSRSTKMIQFFLSR